MAGKGGARDGAGRPRGIPNKATSNAREAIAAFVEGNVDRLNGWLDQIAETDGPLAAFKCVSDILEYHVPKLSRMDNTHSGNINVSVTTGVPVEPKSD